MSQKVFPRREVLAFAVMMEVALRERFANSGWIGPKPAFYSLAVVEQATQLRRAAFLYQTGAPASWNGAEREKVKALAAEVGNAAMIVADVCGGLDRFVAHYHGFDLYMFSIENRTRCEAPHGFNHKLYQWTLSDWMTATLGELGEAANVVKNLNRVRDGIPGNTKSEAELRQDLADELADAFIYLDLTAQAAGIDLPEAIRSKFDRTSEKIGYVEELPF